MSVPTRYVIEKSVRFGIEKTQLPELLQGDKKSRLNLNVNRIRFFIESVSVICEMRSTRIIFDVVHASL